MKYRIEYQGRVWELEAPAMWMAILDWHSLDEVHDVLDPDRVEKVAEGGEQ